LPAAAVSAPLGSEIVLGPAGRGPPVRRWLRSDRMRAVGAAAMAGRGSRDIANKLVISPRRPACTCRTSWASSAPPAAARRRPWARTHLRHQGPHHRRLPPGLGQAQRAPGHRGPARLGGRLGRQRPERGDRLEVPILGRMSEVNDNGLFVEYQISNGTKCRRCDVEGPPRRVGRCRRLWTRRTIWGSGARSLVLLVRDVSRPLGAGHVGVA
jgi:hypothetical protein